VEKGFTRTAIDRELIDPKAQINLANGTIGPARRVPRSFPVPKGQRVNIPAFGLGGAFTASTRVALRTVRLNAAVSYTTTRLHIIPRLVFTPHPSPVHRDSSTRLAPDNAVA